MLSVPPARASSDSPARIACAALTSAWSPEPQSRFTVSAGASIGTPARRPTCRARYMASLLDCSALPKTTSSIRSAATPLRSSAPRAATAASSVAPTPASEPPCSVNGVRAPATTTTSSTNAPLRERAGARLRRSARLVDVEPAPGLAAVEARDRHLPEQRRRRVAGLLQLLVQDLGDVAGRVDPDEVEELERAHRMSAAEPHALVDVLL